MIQLLSLSLSLLQSEHHLPERSAFLLASPFIWIGIEPDHTRLIVSIFDSSLLIAKEIQIKQRVLYVFFQHSNECFCGDSYDKHGTSTNCNMKCSGDNNAICGGPYANSVYSGQLFILRFTLILRVLVSILHSKLRAKCSQVC